MIYNLDSYADINSLAGFCLHEKGILFIDDLSGQALMIDYQGELLWKYSDLRNPVDCCFAAGCFWITDRWNHRVVVIDPHGNFIRSFGKFGTEDKEFNEPWGITALQGDLIAVSDSSNVKIKIFDSAGSFIRSFGTYGSAYQYYESESFKSQEVYKNWRKIVTRYNTFETSFFNSSFKTGTLEIPRGLCYNQGYIYVADISGRIVKFDQQGEFIESYYNLKPYQWVCIHADKLLAANESDSLLYDISGGEISPKECDGAGKMISYQGGLWLASVFNRRLIRIEKHF